LVNVNQDVITDVMAAHLATSLLGHVLFLKNQVPFPVTQLARIPGGNVCTFTLLSPTRLKKLGLWCGSRTQYWLCESEGAVCD